MHDSSINLIDHAPREGVCPNSISFLIRRAARYRAGSWPECWLNSTIWRRRGRVYRRNIIHLEDEPKIIDHPSCRWSIIRRTNEQERSWGVLWWLRAPRNVWSRLQARWSALLLLSVRSCYFSLEIWSIDGNQEEDRRFVSEAGRKFHVHTYTYTHTHFSGNQPRSGNQEVRDIQKRIQKIKNQMKKKKTQKKVTKFPSIMNSSIHTRTRIIQFYLYILYIYIYYFVNLLREKENRTKNTYFPLKTFFHLSSASLIIKEHPCAA